jgi:hypothetical protein
VTRMALLKSFWIAGFESSCHRLADGRRLDLVASTRHDRFAAADYRRLRGLGIATARDGAGWPRAASGRTLDLSALLPRIRAARDAGVQVIWDLCHYGWPDGVDIWKPEFVDRLASYARAVARLVAAETDEPPIYTPINEISFWAWGGGEVAYLNPFARYRGLELKTQLVRAALAAIEAVWQVEPRARILHAEPLIHIVPDPARPRRRAAAEGHRLAQYETFEMLAGRLWPQLGGDERFLDLVGVNYYPRNQWMLEGPVVRQGEPLYRPLRELLAEVHARYRRPLLLAETGAEGDARAGWLAYVGAEVRAAIEQGVPVEGVCLYPILDYPGWDNERHCPTGLWGYADENGEREPHPPLARELARQRALFARREPSGGEAMVLPSSLAAYRTEEEAALVAG